MNSSDLLKFTTSCYTNSLYSCSNTANGAQGPTGPQGPSGSGTNTGAQGPTGVQGSSGQQGAQGNDGVATNTGAQGSQGNIGNAGPQGDTGTAGLQGPQGDTGAAGLQGPQGDTGIAGLQGPQGDTGSIGLQGPQGDTGAQGRDGATTSTGAQGSQGDTGAAGPQGDTGAAGLQGPQGDTGTAGLQGPQGDTGTAGLQGPQGDTGAAGLQGPQGDTGTAGLQGPQGDTGTAGLQGPQGDTGTAGLQGPQGDTGAAGSQGDTGAQGPTGPQATSQPGAVVYQNSINSVVTISQTEGVGSGFFCQIDSPNYAPSSYGYIVTAAHVILDSSNQLSNNIWIHLTYPTITSLKLDGTNGVVMGFDIIGDIALIRINSGIYESLHLPVINSRTQLLNGSYINILGNPQGGDPQSITRGVVRDNKYQFASAISETQNIAFPESVFTDASIYRGNSGGPVITDSNNVVGILAWGINNIVVQQQEEENLNGGIASYLFNPVLSYFCTNYGGTIVSYPKGYLGTFYNNVTFSETMIYGIKIEGVTVLSLDPTIVPAKFNVGDVITEIEGNRIGIYNSQFPFFTEIHLRAPGTSVNTKYLPYDSVSNTYGAETVKIVSLAIFNPANDEFTKNVH
jgi:S1-C subfamily serine protease